LSVPRGTPIRGEGEGLAGGYPTGGEEGSGGYRGGDYIVTFFPNFSFFKGRFFFRKEVLFKGSFF
jgi:hypothetical protein